MRYGDEDGGELRGNALHELTGEAGIGLEPVERLFTLPDTLRGVEAGSSPRVGPELDPCDKPPTARQLSRFKPDAGELRELARQERTFGATGDLAVLSVNAYGAPSYGPIGHPEGLAIHTPENVDHTLAQAIAIAKWQASTGNTSGGSYHGILGWNGTKPMSDPLGWTMVRSVVWNAAAGGLSTRRDAVWAPSRYPWIAQLLSDAAYDDPNRYLQQISLSGKAAWWSGKLGTTAGRAEVRGALVALARWIKILEGSYAYDAVITLHRHWQTNRSDPDGLAIADYILEEYRKITAPVPVPTPPPAPPTRFSDVPRTHPAYAEIEWAAENGIMGGVGDGLFKPAEPLTRAAAARIAYRQAHVIEPPA